MKLIATILATALSATSLFADDPVKHEEALKKYDPVTIEERLDEKGNERAPYDKLSAGLEEHVKAIYVIQKEDFHSENTQAHAHIDKGVICLSEQFEQRSLYHEAAHIRQKALEGTDFNDKWMNIVMKDYGHEAMVYCIGSQIIQLQWKDGSTGANNGKAEPYGDWSLDEDIATFVAAAKYEASAEKVDSVLKKLANNDKNAFDSTLDIFLTVFSLYFCDPKDDRYMRKAKLLHEYKFLTDEEYSKMSKEIGSLYHWIKK